MPPVDPENAQFVIFVRSKRGLKRWFPLNVVTGGTQANLLVKGLDTEMTKARQANAAHDRARRCADARIAQQETSMNTLIREVARTIYKDKVQIEELVRDKFPPMKFAKEIEARFGGSLLPCLPLPC